jgi:hypothetical protein
MTERRRCQKEKNAAPAARRLARPGLPDKVRLKKTYFAFQ